MKQKLATLKQALEEASCWERQLTQYEETRISAKEARERVLKRIFDKYQKKIVKSQYPESSALIKSPT